MPEIASKAVQYGVLRQTHDDYDADQLECIEDLYEGGFAILRKARKYLPRLVNEGTERYDERCKVTSYQPYFGQIVDQFVSDLFGQPLSVKAAADADNPNTPGDSPDAEFYDAFEKDVDLEGTTFVDLMDSCIRTALKQRCALVSVDAPADAIGEESSERAYAYEIPPAQLIDWKLSPGGKSFVWAILNKRERERSSPFGTRKIVKETFTLWATSETPSGFAAWQRYVISYNPDELPNGRPLDEDFVQLEAEGISSFHEIPILRLALPLGLWVGNKIGPQAQEHFQRRSALLSAENRSLVAIPTIKRGPEIPAVGGAIPATVVEDPDRGSRPVERFNKDGFVELGAEDSLEFAEPSGGCYELVDRQLDQLRDGMFAVNHQMAASIRPTAGALGRSGLSKQKDQDATARVLRALGRIVRSFSERVYTTVSDARGDDVHWVAHGLDGYDSEERADLIAEAVSLDEISEALPSETLHLTHARSLAEKLVKGVDPQTISVIIDELAKGIHEKHEMRSLVHDAQVDQIVNPAPPVPPTKPVKPGVQSGKPASNNAET